MMNSNGKRKRRVLKMNLSLDTAGMEWDNKAKYEMYN